MQELEENRRQIERDFKRSERRFQIFLGLVTVILALAAIIVTIASIPNDSWLLCKFGIRECLTGQEPQQRIPEQVGVLSVVEPPGPFIEVSLQMLRAKLMIGADDGALEKRPGILSQVYNYEPFIHGQDQAVTKADHPAMTQTGGSGCGVGLPLQPLA